MGIKYVHGLDERHPDFASNAEAVVGLMKRGDVSSLAQVLGGFIQEQVVLEDPIGQLLTVYDWTGMTGTEQLFQAPPKMIGNRALMFAQGMTLPTAKITQNKVAVQSEEVTTPLYLFDTRDLKRGNLIDAQSIINWGNNALIVKHVLRFYELLGTGAEMTDPAATNSCITVIEDDGTFTYTDTPAYVPVLKRKMEDLGSRLAELMNVQSVGGANVRGFSRQVTADWMARANVSGVNFVSIPAATEDDTERPYFTEGDIMMICPYAASVARVDSVEADEFKPGVYENAYAFRWSHKYVRWATKYLRRFVVIAKQSDNQSGVVETDAFNTEYCDLYFPRPVLKSTISNTKMKLEESSDGGSTWSEVSTPIGSVTVGYDLRHARVTWAASKVTAGNLYRLSNQSGQYYSDMYADAVKHQFAGMVAADNEFQA